MHLSTIAILVLALLLGQCGCQKTPDLRFEPNQVAGGFAGGADALDYVLKNADTMSFEHLFVGANTAYRLGRIEDAGFLLKTGFVRGRYEFKKYQPTSTGGDSPKTYFMFLLNNIGFAVDEELSLRPGEYARVVERVSAWNLKEPPGFKPAWKYELAEVPPDLATTFREQALASPREKSILLNTAEFFQAYKELRESKRLPRDERYSPAEKERRAKAIATMRRIENEKRTKDPFGLDQE